MKNGTEKVEDDGPTTAWIFGGHKQVTFNDTCCPVWVPLFPLTPDPI